MRPSLPPRPSHFTLSFTRVLSTKLHFPLVQHRCPPDTTCANTDSTARLYVNRSIFEDQRISNLFVEPYPFDIFPNFNRVLDFFIPSKMEHPVAYFHCALAASNCYRKNNSNQRYFNSYIKI